MNDFLSLIDINPGRDRKPSDVKHINAPTKKSVTELGVQTPLRYRIPFLLLRNPLPAAGLWGRMNYAQGILY